MLTANDYQKALDSQCACNSCGLVQSLAEVMKRIDGGTDERNEHPIVRLYLTQLCFLAGGNFETAQYTKAHDICTERALEVPKEIVDASLFGIKYGKGNSNV